MPADISQYARISLSVPLELIEWFEVHQLRLSKGKRGGKRLGSGRGGLMVEALERFREQEEQAELDKVSLARQEP